MNYNIVWYGDEKHFGHRIHTFNLDFVNVQPLPERHPQDRHEIRAGESREWIVYWAPLKDLAQVKPAISALISAPMLELERHTLFSGETTELTVHGRQDVNVEVVSPSGERRPIPSQKAQPARRVFAIGSLESFGVHTIQVTAENGKHSEAKVYVRRPWSWYLLQARKEAVARPQNAGTCFEEWVGCFTAFLARKHFPDPHWDKPAEDNFRRVLSQVFDIEKAEPRVMPERIQNAAAMAALLADAYEATGNLVDLELASRLGDGLMTRQDSTGAYIGRCHYTSVTYIAKYMLELAVQEKTLAQDPVWRDRYRRHYASAKAAIDDLEKFRDNIETEGEITFEDGMVSCTALQLGYFALMQNHPAARRKYAEAAQAVLTKHRCLQQLLIPDCRMNGATLRFWEAQYDVQIKKNMFNSPHAWTSWKTYATWYVYLLTGEEELLRQTMDTLGACMQVMEVQTGRLRWGFVPDPFICAERPDPNPAHPDKRMGRETIIGEQYLELLSGGNNDVHEHFKCLEETVLASAYVVERKTGEWVAWNCRVEAADDAIRIYPYEDIVSAVHVNLRQSHHLKIYFDPNQPMALRLSGMKWIRRELARHGKKQAIHASGRKKQPPHKGSNS
jgi:hypothetical protein